MVSFLDTQWKVFPRFMPPVRSTLLVGKGHLETCVEAKTTKHESGPALDRQPRSGRSAKLGKRLDPDLKSWLDNVIIPALVREYLAETDKRNRLASTGVSEVTSD